MPCDLMLTNPEETKRRVTAAALAKLRTRQASVVVVNGKIIIKGFSAAERSGMCDSCILRRVKAEDYGIRRQVEALEQQTGQRIDLHEHA